MLNKKVGNLVFINTEDPVNNIKLTLNDLSIKAKMYIDLPDEQV